MIKTLERILSSHEKLVSDGRIRTVPVVVSLAARAYAEDHPAQFIRRVIKDKTISEYIRFCAEKIQQLNDDRTGKKQGKEPK